MEARQGVSERYIQAFGETVSERPSEVFRRHFANRRDVAAYAGLAPSPYASGGTSREQGISKAGNRLLRTVSTPRR